MFFVPGMMCAASMWTLMMLSSMKTRWRIFSTLSRNENEEDTPLMFRQFVHELLSKLLLKLLHTRFINDGDILLRDIPGSESLQILLDSNPWDDTNYIFFQRNDRFLQRTDNYFQKARNQQQFSEEWQHFSDADHGLLWSNPPNSEYVSTSHIPIPPTPPQNGFFNPGGPVPVLPRAC